MGDEIRVVLLYDELPHYFTCWVSPGIGVLYHYLIVFTRLFIVRWPFSSRIQALLTLEPKVVRQRFVLGVECGIDW